MSLIVSLQTEIRGMVALELACRRMRWQWLSSGKFTVLTRTGEGVAVEPPQWRYPTVCDLADRTAIYDHEGRWGDPEDVRRFKQARAIEETILEARRAGRLVAERTLRDGSVELNISVRRVSERDNASSFALPWMVTRKFALKAFRAVAANRLVGLLSKLSDEPRLGS